MKHPEGLSLFLSLSLTSPFATKMKHPEALSLSLSHIPLCEKNEAPRSHPWRLEKGIAISQIWNSIPIVLEWKRPAIWGGRSESRNARWVSDPGNYDCEWKICSLWLSFLELSLKCRILWRTRSSPTSGARTVASSWLSSSSLDSKVSWPLSLMGSSIRIGGLKVSIPLAFEAPLASSCLGNSLNSLAVILASVFFRRHFGLWGRVDLRWDIRLGIWASIVPLVLGIFFHLSG